MANKRYAAKILENVQVINSPKNSQNYKPIDGIVRIDLMTSPNLVTFSYEAKQNEAKILTISLHSLCFKYINNQEPQFHYEELL